MKYIPIPKRSTRRESETSSGKLIASSTNVRATHGVEPIPSTDWTELSNILRRSGGGFSHTRKPAG